MRVVPAAFFAAFSSLDGGQKERVRGFSSSVPNSFPNFVHNILRGGGCEAEEWEGRKQYIELRSDSETNFAKLFYS